MAAGVVDQPIRMIIQGIKGRTNNILLNDLMKDDEKKSFQSGSVDRFEMEHEDLGRVWFSSRWKKTKLFSFD